MSVRISWMAGGEFRPTKRGVARVGNERSVDLIAKTIACQCGVMF
jgi:hypothetical protein